jgi:laminin alpha 1/2
VTGRDCSKCADRHVIIGKICTSCDDQCTGVLLNDMREITANLKDVHVDREAVSAIKHLYKWDNISKALLSKIENRIVVGTFFDDLPNYQNLGLMMTARGHEMEERCGERFIESYSSKEKSQQINNRINLIKNEIRGCILLFDDYAQGNVVFEIDPEWARNEINGITEELKKIGRALEELADTAEDELDYVNDLKEIVLVKIFNSSAVSKLHNEMSGMRSRLEDFMQYISQANKNSDEVSC